MSPLDMVKTGERFFTSLGFAPLPPTFYERSLFTKPADREVVCHASAWVVDLEEDLRIKMCIDPTPLHRCSIYDSKPAGQRLNAMLQMGLSKPWPEALEALTGAKQMDATATRDYFAPLQAWLDEQLRDKPRGW